MMIRSVFAGLLLSLTVPAVAATLKADYQFQNNFTSSVGGAPALTTEGTGTMSFQTESVDGGPRTVYQFNLPGGNSVGAGLRAQTDGLINPSSYSIVIYSNLSLINNAISKIIDFKNLTSDAGLYTVSNVPTFYDALTPVAFSPTPLPSGSYAQLVFTRGGTGTVTAYIDGTQVFSFNDTTNLAVIDDPASTSEYLHFFFDDPNSTVVTTGLSIENAAGSIARLRLYDGDLTATEVASLDTVPEPTLLPVTGLMLLMLRRKCRAPGAAHPAGQRRRAKRHEANAR